jgi:outer membrane receptor protein involved in Fe transport
MNKTYPGINRPALAALAFVFGAASIRAQTAPAAAATPAATTTASAKTEDAIKLEAYTVTGSTIKRLEMEQVLPVTVFNKDLIDSRNALTPVELLTALPQITNVPLNESAIGGANARGDNASVNLRGIGISGTLVLLNGRRVAPHPVTTPDAGSLAFSANVNALPTQGIERIEVLRDGASSIYGSDAVAGVINYITRRDYRGTELRLRVGVPEHGGGENVQFTVTHGREFLHGRLRSLTTLDGFKRNEISYTKRSFSKNADHSPQAPAPFNVPGSAFDNRSSTSFWPQFRVGTAAAANYFRPVNGTPTLTTSAPTRANAPEYFINVNQYQNQGYSRSDRQNFFQGFEYDINDRITAFADLSFYHSNTYVHRQAIPFTAPSSEPLSTISANNPFNPYGSRFYDPQGRPNADGTPRLTGTPQNLVLVTHTLGDLGPEQIRVFSGAYRGVAGLRGKLFNSWNWESGALYSRAYTTDKSPYGVRLSLFQDALQRTDNNAYNPFGYTFKVAGNAVVADQPYKNPQPVLDSFVRTWRREGFSSIASADAHVSGPVFSYWRNTVSLSVGGEFRKEEFIDHRPEFAGTNPPGALNTGKDNDFLLASPKPNSAGDRTIASGFAETVIPVVQSLHQIPLVHSLELTSSVRYEHYSDFGNTTRPKVGLNWKPYNGLMVRASFNEGFAAPNLPTLYAPSQFTVDSLPGNVDPYWGPATGRGPYPMRNYSEGNRALKPVTSIGKSVGVVLEVPKVKGLAITADYWQIDQNNLIGSRTTSQILNADFAALNAYVQSQVAAGKTAAQIDLGSGTANYKGDAGVERLAPSAQDIADFAAYNAGKPASQQLPVVGQILGRHARYENLAKAYANGVDMSLSYTLPELPLGRVNVSTDWTYSMRSYQVRNVAGAAPLFLERMNVDGTTRWRGTGTVTWRKGNWNANASAYYIGSFADAGATTNAASYTSLGAPGYLSKQFDSGTYLYRYVVRDITTYNASIGYRFAGGGPKWLGRSSIRVGVINLTDREPPLSSATAGFSSSVHGSLFPGRTWTVELARQF